MADVRVKGWAGEAACSLALTATGLAFAAAARGMGLFEDGVPGPGMAPLLLGIALAALGVGIAAQACWKRAGGLVAVMDRDTALAIFLLLVAVLAFEGVGYVPSTFLFLLASFVLVGRARWLPAIAVAGAATLLTWALFVKALGVPLPVGLMPFL